MPLDEVRRAVAGADEALLCVAFVHARGLNLIAKQLPPRGRVRLLATTSFGTTTAEGLQLARQRGIDVRILNLPAGSTYHPKVYLGRHGERTHAVVGSANLTGGLATNIEAVVTLEGDSSAVQLEGLWSDAEGWWNHPLTTPVPEADLLLTHEHLPRDLQARVEELLRRTDTVYTLSDGRPNHITSLVDDGIFVETERSSTPQLVPAWMVTVAWEWLTGQGWLTNRHLLADDGLNVKRSSFVCALLATLPGVDVRSRRPIELAYRGAGPGQRPAVAVEYEGTANSEDPPPD